MVAVWQRFAQSCTNFTLSQAWKTTGLRKKMARKDKKCTVWSQQREYFPQTDNCYFYLLALYIRRVEFIYTADTFIVCAAFVSSNSGRITNPQNKP